MTTYNVIHVLSLNKKAFLQIYQKYPAIFWVSGINSVYSVAIPYITLYITALILGELSHGKMEKAWKFVILSLLISLLSGVFDILLKHWQNYLHTIFRIDKEMNFTNKILSLDFKDAELPYTNQLLSQIHMNEQFAGYGLGKILDIYKKMIVAVTKIVGAIVLSTSLFTAHVTNKSFTFLDSKVFALIIFAIMTYIAIAAPQIANKAQVYWASIANKASLANKLFSFYGYLAYNQRNALDIRFYQQNAMCEKEGQRFNAFKPGGEVANCAKGYMGVQLSLSTAISYILNWFVYAFVCLKSYAGAFGIGLVTQYIGALLSMSNGISELLEAYGDMSTNTEFLNSTFEFLNIPTNIDQTHNSSKKIAGIGIIEFINVSFKYPNSEKWVLENVNCKIKKGNHIAIVGENGSGKTTFVKLLCRLYKPDKGEILLDGININNYEYNTYIHNIATVFQDYNLLSQTIATNIAGSDKFDISKVRDCIEQLDLSKFIDTLSKQENTYLYKDYVTDGIYLSGGEEQKIVIARALYKDAICLILDEPTATLDPISESTVYKLLNDISRGKTMVFVSHRLSACIFCDDIFVFDKGRIIQNGNHHVLLKENGKYKELWNAQSQYYL